MVAGRRRRRRRVMERLEGVMALGERAVSCKV